jgi:hypothetical protein
MDNNNYIFKTKPGLRLLILGVVGSTGFGFFDYILAFSKWDFSDTGQIAGHLIQYSFVAVITAIFITGLWLIIGFKQYILTENELIVERPLIFTCQIIQLSDIQKVYSEDYTMKVADNKNPFEKDKNQLEVYHGRKVTILLKNQKKLQLTSFEVSGCQLLAKEINKQLYNLIKQH